MMAWAPCMQWLMVPTPRRPLCDISRTSSAPRHFGRWPGRMKYSHTVGRGAAMSNSITLAADEAAGGRLGAGQAPVVHRHRLLRLGDDHHLVRPADPRPARPDALAVGDPGQH